MTGALVPVEAVKLYGAATRDGRSIVAYVPLLATENDAAAISRLARSDLVVESHAAWRWLRNAGMAIAARMPMMMITTMSSIRVKPFSFSPSSSAARRLAIASLIVLIMNVPP